MKNEIWAVPFSLAATKGIAICFLFLRLLKCFTSAGLLSDLHRSHVTFATRGFPIRISPDQRLLDTSPKHFAVTPRPSSPTQSRVIHHMPL